MARGYAQVYGFVLAYAGLICLIIATYASEWKVLKHSMEGLAKPIVVRAGLWMACSMPTARKLECTVYDTVPHIPSKCIFLANKLT